MDLEPQLTNAANAAVAMVTTYGLRVVGAIIILVDRLDGLAPAL